MNKNEKIQSILSVPYTMSNNTFICTNHALEPSKTVGEGPASRLQAFLKKWPRLYYFLVMTFSPVLMSNAMGLCLKRVLNRFGSDAIVLNIGSGPLGLPQRPDIINVDLSTFDLVNVCADATDLPFSDNSVDCIINLAMLEHVVNPEAVVDEMRRVLKPGGEYFCYVPFCVPMHAAPYDYFRWTQDGVKLLFKALTVAEVNVGAGPTSCWLWITSEWLSMILSMGNKQFKELLSLFIMLVLFPLKYLDKILDRHPGANTIASGFYIAGKKD